MAGSRSVGWHVAAIYLGVDFDEILPRREDGAAHLVRARDRIDGVELAMLLRRAFEDLLARDALWRD